MSGYRHQQAQEKAFLRKKTRLGDWELDTIIGAGHKGVIVSMPFYIP